MNAKHIIKISQINHNRKLLLKWQLVYNCIFTVRLLMCSSECSSKLSAEEIERKITDLLGQMTIEEKLGQLQQLDGEANGNHRPEHLDMARKGLLGSTLNVRGAKMVNELHAASQESRLKIPILLGFDVIHGYRTLFPIPLGETATWDLDIAEKAAAIAAAEAKSVGLHWTFAPMVDVGRDPRWGRVMEGSGKTYPDDMCKITRLMFFFPTIIYSNLIIGSLSFSLIP